MNPRLPGELAYVFLVSIVDAILLSWITVAWYRRSVRRLMRVRGSENTDRDAPMPSGAAAPSEPLAPGLLTFALYDDTGARHGAVTAASPGSHKRLILAYLLGTALFSAIVTGFQLGAESTAPPFVAWFGTWCINAWPLVPTLAILLVRDRASSVRMALQYVVGTVAAVVLVTLVPQALRGSFNSAPLTNAYWIVVGLVATAWAPLVLVFIMGWRRTRTVFPLALAGTLVFGFGSLAFRDALVRAFNLPAFRSGFLELAALTNTQAAYYGLFMIVSIPVGYLAWRFLRWLAGAFARKRFSDVQLMIDCWWVVITADIAATALTLDYGIGGLAIAMAAWAAFRIPVAVLLRAGGGSVRAPAARRLLLLRVFGYEARTETLFDRVAQHWRFHGPVQLIAGVDLAARTTDPADLLAFLNGRLGENYVASPAEIPRRIQELDYARDPDGRHRINELYCHDDTWRDVLQGLLDLSDIVLMDLRSFSKQNSGCVFELQQLVRRVPSNSIVLTCDASTDLALLGRILTEAWNHAVADGCASGSGEIAIVRLTSGRRTEFAVLLQRLMGVARPRHVFQATELPVALA